MTDITLADFEELIAEAYALDADLEKLKREIIDPKRQRLEELEAQILTVLEKQEITSYKSKHGTVVRSVRYTVKVPQELEAKADFFKWLNDKGREVYWDYVTVNHQKLNSLYKAEVEIAKEEGNFDFKIPGLGEPAAMPILSRRKA